MDIGGGGGRGRGDCDITQATKRTQKMTCPRALESKAEPGNQPVDQSGTNGSTTVVVPLGLHFSP